LQRVLRHIGWLHASYCYRRVSSLKFLALASHLQQAVHEVVCGCVPLEVGRLRQEAKRLAVEVD
jgi:hypothetical protein